eukprot:15358778-Ditylum_brightwellii.AAC.1
MVCLVGGTKVLHAPPGGGCCQRQIAKQDERRVGRGQGPHFGLSAIKPVPPSEHLVVCQRETQRNGTSLQAVSSVA